MRTGHLVLLSALCVASCFSRPRATRFDETEGGSSKTDKGELVEIDLGSGAPESTDSAGLFPLPAARTYAGLVRTIERAASDKDTTGVFVRLGLGSMALANSEELGAELEHLRKSGKPVVCHAHQLGNSTILLFARGCDRIWLSPAGEVASVGIAAQVVYLKRLLDRLDIGTDFLHMGRYKSAVESLTRVGPSDDAREALEESLQSVRKSWFDGVTQARPTKTVKDSLETGPWSAKEAKQRGLIDEIGVESDARKDARERAHAGKLRVAYGPSAHADDGPSLIEVLRLLAGGGESTGGRAHVAVVPGEGAIVTGGGDLFGGGIAERAFSKTLRRLAKDDSVKAVVLRLDSPGGSALASDLIYAEVAELKKRKPVVTSVGAMAASGGYYIACASNRIIAESTSIVGSIGVFGGKIVLGAALRDLGIDSVTFAANPAPGAEARAAYLSALTPWDDATRERVRAQMAATYDLFIDRCAAGRGLPAEQIRKVAEGRIWTGAQGKERGLVDELGGLVRAIQAARELGKLEKDAPVSVEGSSEGLLEALMLSDDASDEEIARALPHAKARARVFDALPRELRPYAATLSPLAGGERVLSALPFALLIR